MKHFFIGSALASHAYCDELRLDFNSPPRWEFYFLHRSSAAATCERVEWSWFLIYEATNTNGIAACLSRETWVGGKIVYFLASLLQTLRFRTCIKQLLMNLWRQCWLCNHRQFLEFLELQALANSHAIHVNFQRVNLQINLLLLQHLCVEQVAQRRLRLQ